MSKQKEKYLYAQRLIDDKSDKYLVEGTNMLKELAQQGYMPANDFMCAHYRHGIGCERDYALSLACCLKSVENYGDESNPAWHTMGMMYFEGGFNLQQDYSKAFTCFETYINTPEMWDEHRVGECLHYMGLMYKNGLAVEKNNVRAYAYLKPAIQFGYYASKPFLFEIEKILIGSELRDAKYEARWRYLKLTRSLENSEKEFIEFMNNLGFIVEWNAE